MRIAPKETSLLPLLWRCLIGPAHLLDGLIGTLTLGKIQAGFTLATARRLALSRLQARMEGTLEDLDKLHKLFISRRRA